MVRLTNDKSRLEAESEGVERFEAAPGRQIQILTSPPPEGIEEALLLLVLATSSQLHLF